MFVVDFDFASGDYLTRPIKNGMHVFGIVTMTSIWPSSGTGDDVFDISIGSKSSHKYGKFDQGNFVTPL